MANLLEVKDLEISFQGDNGGPKLDRIGFSIKEGEFLCIVGESGCGKSITSLAIMGLLPSSAHISGGQIKYQEQDLTKLSEKQLNQIRGHEITMIFQDAMTSLNPVFTIGNQLKESIMAHTEVTKEEAERKAISLLKKVGLREPEKLMKKFPFVLSGGQRQRVMIAMALAGEPKLLIADEPTTALDVTIQAQIMQLLRALQKEIGMTVLLITHDMGLVAQMADRVLVMYAGQIVEKSEVFDLFQKPAHPYTKALLQTVPGTRDDPERVLVSIPGSVPEAYQNIKGCRFADRCEYVQEQCQSKQELIPIGQSHEVRCLLYKNKNKIV